MELKLFIVWIGVLLSMFGFNFSDILKNHFTSKKRKIIQSFLLILAVFLTIKIVKNEEIKKEEKFNNVIFLSLQELKNNRGYLSDLHKSLKTKSKVVRIGEIKCERTKSLADTLYKEIIRYSYGEEKNLYGLVSRLSDCANEFKQVKNYNDLSNWNKTHEMTIDDIYFLNSFLYWYLGNTFKEKEEINKYFSPIEFESDKLFQKNDKINMRYFINKNKPIIEYSEYLGLID